MEKKIPLVAGLFIVLSIFGTAYFITPEDQPNAYYCNDTNTVALCFKLSAINVNNFSTRCYYNLSAQTRYKNCKSGWESFMEVEFNATPGESPDKEDVVLNLSTKEVLKRMGIGTIEENGSVVSELIVSDLICIGGFCKAKLYQEDAINKEIEIPLNYKNCTQWINETCNTTEIIEYSDTELKALRDEAIETLLDRLAVVHISRETVKETETKLPGGIVDING